MSEVGALEHILDCEDWKSKQKHVFILSSAGKPVYSRYGSEEKLVTLFGVMQALVSVTQDMDDDSIEAIYFGSRTLVFSVKGPIILVAVSSTREPLSFLNKQLSYVYSQIVSVLTLSQVTRIFEERRNYDLRRLLTGSERLIDSLLKSTELEPDLLINGVSCLPLPLNSREAISNTIISTCSKIKNLVFVILVAGNKLITLVRMKKYHISPSDLHLVFNMVNASESFKTAESWTPICLPNFDSSGFLHCHVSYLTEDCNACLLLFTVDRDLFFELSDAKKKITEKLKRNNLLTTINDAVRKIDGITASLYMAPVRHFIYKDCRSGGVISPSIAAAPYENAAGWTALMKHYQILYDELHSPIGQLKLIYRQFSVDTIIAWVNEKFEIYVILEPLISKTNAIDAVNKLWQLIQKEEDRFFISNIPIF